jgi:hypothetical protein
METKTFETGVKHWAGRRGKTLATGVLLVLMAWPAFGEEVYRCRYKGGVAYTSEPTLPSCRRIHLDVPQPDPKEVDRLARERQQRFARELEAEQRAQTERLVRARQLEVEAQLRQARAAEIEAQASLNCMQYAVPLIYSSSPIYPETYYGLRRDAYDYYRMDFPSTTRLSISPSNLSYHSGYYRQLRDDYYRMIAPLSTEP